jgi:Tat protein translocase TatC
MTLMDHLRELRTRLIWIVGSLLIGTLIAMLFSEAIVRFIIGPLSVSGTVPLVIDPTAPIGIFFQVSLTTGAILALPIILYQIIAFMAPGLYPNEKRAVLFILPGAMVLFGIGAAFAYFMLVPVAVGFLQGFWSGLIRADWTLDRPFVRNAVDHFLFRPHRIGQRAGHARLLAAGSGDHRTGGGSHYAHGRSCQHVIGDVAAGGPVCRLHRARLFALQTAYPA